MSHFVSQPITEHGITAALTGGGQDSHGNINNCWFQNATLPNWKTMCCRYMMWTQSEFQSRVQHYCCPFQWVCCAAHRGVLKTTGSCVRLKPLMKKPANTTAISPNRTTLMSWRGAGIFQNKVKNDVSLFLLCKVTPPASTQQLLCLLWVWQAG